MAESHERTIEVLKTALLVNPRDASKRFMLGKAYRGLEDWENAEQALEKAVSLKPDYAKAYYYLGLTREERENTAGAAESFASCIEHDPDNIDATRRLGRARAALAEHEPAAEAFERVLAEEPGDAEATRGAFDGWHDAERHENACRHLAEVIEVADDPEHAARAAKSLEAAELRDRAEALLLALAAHDTSAGWVHAALVRVRFALEKWAEVISSVGALRAVDGEGAACLEAGRAHAALSQWPEAAAELTAAATDDAPPELVRDAAIANLRAGDAERAVELFRRAGEKLSGDVLLTQEWARARAALGRDVEALELAQRAAALPGATARTHTILAERYEALGKLDETVAAYEAALALDAEDAVVHASLARSRLAAGDTDGAIVALQDSTRLDPTSSANWLLLGDQLLRAERAEEALAAFEAAAGLAEDDVDALRGIALARAMLAQLGESIVAAEAWAAASPGRESFTALGSNLLLAERAAEAAAALERAFVFDGTALDTGRLLARAQLAVGSVERARETLATLRNHHADDVAVQRLLAQTCLDLGDDQAALDAVEVALRQAPKDAQLHALAARAKLNTGDRSGAVSSLEQALWLDPENVPLRVRLAETLRKLGRAKEATDSLRIAVAREPDNARAHFELGRCMDEAEDVAGAEAAYARALECDPEHAASHYRLGLILRDRGQLERASNAFRRAAELEPDFAEAHMASGAVLLQLGDTDGALFALRSAARLAPDHTPTLIALARAYAGAERPHDAAIHYEKAREQDPGNPDIELPLANTLITLDRGADALAVLRQLLETQPDNVDAHATMARYHRRAGDLPLAVTSFEGACRARPDDAGLVLELAEALHESGENDRALMAAKRARKLGADDAACASLLGRVHGALQQWADAATELETTLDAADSPDRALAEQYAMAIADSREWSRLVGRDEKLAVFEDSAIIMRGLGWARFETGLTERALAAFEAALRQDLDDEDATAGAGLARAKLGQHALAAPLLSRLSQPGPRELEALGLCRLDLGELEGGIAALEQAGAPRSNDATLRLLWAYRNAGRDADFKALGAQVLAGTRNDAVAAALAGQCLNEDRPQEAVDMLSPIEADLGGMGLAALGRALVATGEHRSAVHRFRRAASLADLDATSKGAFGLALVQEAQVEEGLGLIEEATHEGRASLEMLRVAANGHRALGNHGKAADALLHSLLLAPSDPELRYECGVELHRANRTPDAMKQFHALKPLDRSKAEQLFKLLTR